LIVVEERENPSPLFKVLVLCLSLIAGFAAMGLLFLINRVDPVFALTKIFTGSFGSLYGLSETVSKAIPLILAGGGLAVAFRGKFWNIGAESQLLMGAIFSTWVGLNLSPGLPYPLSIAFLFMAGFVGGAIWGVIPAVLKVRFGMNEVISTLMLNYVAAELLNFLIVGPWKGATQHGYPYTDDLPPNAVLSLIPGTRIHWLTLVIGLAAAAILFFLLYRTKFGYEVRVVGESPEAARYAGIDFFKTAVVMMVISGGVAGLAGVGEVAGVHHHLGYPQGISAGYGFTAIITAWLGRLNPLLVILSSLFFAGIVVGGDAIQISLGLPAATINVFDGVILFFLIAGDWFLNNRIVFRRGEPMEAAE
jgi:general nucleoside transport system permease protein